MLCFQVAQQRFKAALELFYIPLNPVFYALRYEAEAQQRFKALLEASPGMQQEFTVPGVVPDLCSQRVLTTEWVSGVAIDKVKDLPQEVRDKVRVSGLGFRG